MLSDRLKQIVKMIDSNKVVFDVGSDHALLPCFLVKNGICDKAYAAEIAQGPLSRSIETINKYQLQDKVIPVLSDGLSNVKDDVDVVVIAGMGFHTIKHILDNCDIEKYDYFIVQSNNDVDLLRHYISDHHYTILDESIVFDGFYYQIIKFSKTYNTGYDAMQIEFGPVLLNRKDDVFIEYLKYRKDVLVRINKQANKLEYDLNIKRIEEILYN